MLSPNSHAKIHPVDLIKNPELFDREPEIVPETSGKSGKIFAADSMDSEYDGAGELVARERGNAPFRARSVSFSVSQRIRRTSTASFLTNASGGTTSGMNVEILINFLTTNLDQLAASDREYLRRFEELSLEVLCEAHDAELHRIFKAHGWTGSRYRSSEDKPLEAPSLLQALSNLYLKNKMSNYTTHISNLFGIGDEKGADQILSFCPDLLLTCLKTQGPIRPHSTDVRTYTFTGACMLADISGFSKFSGSMCQKGVSGLDDLREATSGFLGHLVKTVYEYHGDVIAFAGDALVCVFLDIPPEEGEKMDDMARYKASGCLRALQCACILRTYHTSKLSAHLGVSFGEMKLALLGGLHDQWVYLMNGACVSELAKCIDDAGPKEVAATQECYERALKAFNEFIDSTPAPALATIDKKRQIDDGGGLRMAALKHSDSNQAIVRTDSRESMDEATPIIKTRACKEGSTNILVDAVDEIYIGTKKQKTPGGRRLSLLRRQTTRKIDLLNAIPTQDERGEQMGILESAAFFVPRPILAAVYSESLEHIGELRQVTTMFLSLDSYSPILHRDPSSLQPFFLMAQGILFEAGGFLRQFLVDDKGCVFIAMWGMPSFTYANNCSRALSCGVSIGMGAKELDHKCSIGITTGNVFCGSVGAPERRDYAGIGNEVNLAARLMGKAKGRVLIDESTYTNLNHVTKQLLRPAEEMKLKGMDKPITPYEYASDTIPRVAALDENPGYSTILRKQVKAILSTQMDKITNSNPLAMHSNEPKNVYFTIILGMPGTGKSTAAEYFRHGLRKRNIPCLLIQARPGHEGVPYGLMRELFLELIGEENFITEAQQRQQITYLVEQAYPESEEVEKEKARLSIELVLGVEWSDIFQSRIPGDYSPQDPDSGRRGSTSAQENSNRKSPLKVTSPRSPKNSLHKNAVMNNSQSTHSSNSDNFTELGSNKQSQFGLLEDYNKTMSRAVGDLSFYKIICILLRNTRTAIVIEDAHFCDELSWNELHLLLTGSELDLVVLITMRSNTNVKANVGGSSDFMAPFQGDRTTTKRQSVLASQIDSNAIAGSTVGEGDMVSRYGLKFQTSASYLSILGHENSIVVEMTSLNESEVKEILMHTLKVDDISSDLVKLVLDVSSGNAFWCKAIANFIKERGVKELEKATEGDNHNRQNSLKQLILLRMEKLNVDQQLVLKHAAIIGDEFSEKMLKAAIPEKLKPNLSESLELLVEHGFILCIDEYPEPIFGFENQFIRQTVFELTPPRDAAHIHLAVAEFIESEYSKNLRPFYPILAQHYLHSIGKRALAFKYKVKAADQAISRGAFNDGLQFAQSAAKLAVSKEELRVLLMVISRAVRDITAANGGLNATNSSTGRRMSSTFNAGGTPNNAENNFGNSEVSQRMSTYIQLKISTEAALEKLSKGAVKSEEVTPGNKNRLVIHKQPSGRLNWQPSYVASKLDDDSSSESSSENSDVKKKACCMIQ